MIDTKLSNVTDCGTKHHLNYIVVNEDSLNKIVNRYYKVDDELKMVKKDSYHLIGKTIKLRSPITCDIDEGVCDICYGKLAEINRSKHAGIVSVLSLTEQITQMLLSAKHLLQAVSDKIEWGNLFNKYFIVDRNMIFINRDNITKDVNLVMKEEDLHTGCAHHQYTSLLLS